VLFCPSMQPNTDLGRNRTQKNHGWIWLDGLNPNLAAPWLALMWLCPFKPPKPAFQTPQCCFLSLIVRVDDAILVWV